MDVKDEIRARLPIDQLVAQYCQIKRKGRNFVSLCPFHNDSHPSFLISPDKGIAYCFACQSGGDIFSFFQKIESVDFPTAVKMLAEKAGVDIPKDNFTPKKPSVSKDEKDRLRECLAAASKFYEEKLKSIPMALSYVQNRGVPPELMEKFGIGYAPDSFSETYDHLLKLGFSRTELVAAGLGVQKELEGKIYDRFRHRIMFPIRDAQGIIIGFGGRAMGDSDAKYVNSPESPLYNKSAVLFGLFQARDAIRKTRKVVLVEGYFDCIAAHKAGVEHVVAVSGTALTEEHVKILRRHADDVILCLDQDNAGQLAAVRAFDLLSRAHLRINSATLPAKDPDELVQKDPALFAHLINDTASPYIDSVISRLKLRPDIGEPAGKRIVSETLFPLLDAVPTAVEVRAYMQKAAQSFGVIESEFDRDYREWKTQSGGPAKKIDPSQKMSEAPYSRYELCIGFALLYPAVRALVSELIPPADNPYAPILTALPLSGESPTIDILTPIEMDPLLKEKLNVLALYCEENFPLWSDNLAPKEFRKLVLSSNREKMLEKQFAIVKELKEAREKGRPDEEARLLTQYQQLLKLTKMASES